MHGRITISSLPSPLINKHKVRNNINLVMVCADARMIVLHFNLFLHIERSICAVVGHVCTEFSFDSNFPQKLDYIRPQVICISSKFSSFNRKRYYMLRYNPLLLNTADSATAKLMNKLEQTLYIATHRNGFNVIISITNISISKLMPLSKHTTMTNNMSKHVGDTNEYRIPIETKRRTNLCAIVFAVIGTLWSVAANSTQQQNNIE